MLKHAELFMQGLKIFKFGFSSEDREGKTLVYLPIDDKDKIVCLFDGDDGQWFTVFTVIDGVPADKIFKAVALCNELNTKHMWAKFTVGPGQNGSKAVHINNSALLAEAETAAQAIELLFKFIDICEAEISNIRNFIGA